MKQIRIGKDISVRWSVLTNGIAESLEGRDLELLVRAPACVERKQEFRVEDNFVLFAIAGVEQLETGTYSLTLWENRGKTGQTAVDSCKAFRLVSSTCKESGVSGELETVVVQLETSSLELGMQGPRGISAYASAVAGGYPQSLDEATFNSDLAKVSTKEDSPILEPITGSVASLNVLGGHTYNCGELTSLTFARVEDSPRESVVVFRSGATATTVFYPNGLTVVGYSRPEPNKSYEISIRASRAIIVSGQ